MQHELILDACKYCLGAFFATLLFLLIFVFWKAEIVAKFRLKLGFAEVELAKADVPLTKVDETQIQRYLLVLKNAIDLDVFKTNKTLLKLPYCKVDSNHSNRNFDVSRELVQILNGELTPVILLIGGMGSGKTSTLHDLAKQLVNQHYSTVPVLIQAANWKAKYKTLENFVIGQLRASYRVPESVGKELLRLENLTLLIDGADDLGHTGQLDFANALRNFLSTHGLTPVVVSARADFVPVDSSIGFTQVLELLPLGEGSIQNFVACEQVPYVMEALHKDPALMEMASSPLFLCIFTSVFGTQELDLSSLTLDEKKKLALKEFLLKRIKIIRLIPQSDSVRVFSWMANSMAKFGTVDFVLDSLQPDWLQPWFFRILYVLGSIIFVIVCMVPINLLLYVFLKMTNQSSPMELFVVLSIVIGLISSVCNYRIKPFGQIEISLEKIQPSFWLGLFTGMITWIIATSFVLCGASVCFAGLVGVACGGVFWEPWIWTAFFALIPVFVYFWKKYRQLCALLNLNFILGFPVVFLSILGFLGLPLYAVGAFLEGDSIWAGLVATLLVGALISLAFVSEKRLSGFLKKGILISALSLAGGMFLLCLSYFVFEAYYEASHIDVIELLASGKLNSLIGVWTWICREAEPARKALSSLLQLLFSCVVGTSSIWSISYIIQNLRGTESCVEESAPNALITKSLRNSFVCSVLGAAATIFVSVIFTPLYFFVEKLFPGFLNVTNFQPQFRLFLIGLGLMQGATVGFILAVLPVVQHYIVRILLSSSGAAPFDLFGFLEQGVKARILLRLGGSYRFCHSYVADYFRDKQLTRELIDHSAQTISGEIVD